jgi:opacity protein-like surface antigen
MRISGKNITVVAAMLLIQGIAQADDQAELARQATDPTASLMAFNFQGTYVGGYHGSSIPGEADDAFQFAFRPVIPLEFLGKPNILRLTIPYQTGGRGDEGFGPISLFDLVVFNEKWGRWGVGPVMSFDTTGDAPDSFVIGPAIGFVKQESKKFNWGLFSQNVFWSNTAVTQIQPVIAYQLGNGWSLSAGDLQFTYDWNAGQWLNLPVGFQIGKVTQIGSQPVRFAINPQYNLKSNRGLNEWQCTFTFTALFPTP